MDEPWCTPSADSASSGAGTNPEGFPRGNPLARRGQPNTGLLAMCARGLRRLMITGLIRDMLTRHFASAAAIDPSVRKIIWKNANDTGILIESVYRWKAELAGKQPALVIKPNDMNRERIAIADSGGLSAAGQPSYTVLWLGSHTVFATASLGPAVEAIAAEAAALLDHFGPALVKNLSLLRWQVQSVGAVAEVEEAPEVWGVPINVAWAYRDDWRLETESATMRAVDMTVLTDG